MISLPQKDCPSCHANIHLSFSRYYSIMVIIKTHDDCMFLEFKAVPVWLKCSVFPLQQDTLRHGSLEACQLCCVMTYVCPPVKSPGTNCALVRITEYRKFLCTRSFREDYAFISLSSALPFASLSFKKWSFSQPNSDWHEQCNRSQARAVFLFFSFSPTGLKLHSRVWQNILLRFLSPLKNVIWWHSKYNCLGCKPPFLDSPFDKIIYYCLWW